MSTDSALPDDDESLTALAGRDSVLWRHGRDGLAGRLSNACRSELRDWLAKINNNPRLWNRYGTGQDTARHLATATGEIILAAAALSAGEFEPFLTHLHTAVVANGDALGIPLAAPVNPSNVPNGTGVWDRSPADRLNFANQYMNELERFVPGDRRGALGGARSAISDLVESGAERVLLGRLQFRVQLPVAVILLGAGAAEGAGRAYRLTVEWFDRPGEPLLVRDPVALGCSVLDHQFEQAERAAWAVAVGQRLFRERGFVRWGTDMAPGPEAVAIGGPSAGGALATALVSLGERRRPVWALVLGHVDPNECVNTKTGAGTLHEVSNVAEKVMAAVEMLRVGRVVLWRSEPGTDDTSDVRDDLQFLQQEHPNLAVTRLATVRKAVDHLSSSRTHPRTKWAGIVGVLLLFLLTTTGGTYAYVSRLGIEKKVDVEKERSERVAVLVRLHEDDLKRKEWPLDQMKGHLEAMARDDVEIANANWAKFADALRTRIETTPYPNEDEVERYQAALVLLESHDRHLAETVRAVLEPRRAHLQLQWKLPLPAAEPLPGLVPNPAPQLGRWQLETRESRGGWKCGAGSPNGKLLAFACQDGHVRVKDIETGDLVHFFVGHTDEVGCVAWSPDSRFLASSGRDRTVRVWDTENAERPRVFKPGKTINCLAWNKDNKRLLAGGTGQLCLWNARTDKGVMQDLLPGALVSAVAWNPDGTEIVIVGEHQNALIWKVTLNADGQVGNKQSLRVPDSTKQLFCVAWSPNGEMIAAGGRGQLAKHSSDSLAPGGKSEVHAWAARDRELKWSVNDDFGLAIRVLAWNKDSTRLAVGTQAGRVCEHNYVSVHDELGKQTGCAPTNQPINSLVWSPDSSRLLTGHWDNSCRFWKADGTPLPGNIKFAAPIGAFNALTFDADKKMFALGTRTGEVRLGNLDGRNVRILSDLPVIERIAWNPTDNRLALFGWGDNIHVRGTDPQKPVTIWIKSKQPCDIDWSRDGKQLVAGGEDGSVRIWSADGTEAERPPVQKDGVRAVAWNPDNKRVAIGLGWKDGTVRIWDVEKRREGPQATGHGPGIIRLQWSPDGQHLASSSSNGTVKIWDAQLRPVGKPMVHTTAARTLAWSPNNDRLATGDDSGTCRIWTSKGEPVHHFKASAGRILALAWSADGKHLISGSEDGIARYTDLESHKLVHLLVPLPGENAVTLSARGEILSASPNTDGALLYLVEGGAGYMNLLGMDEYRKRWKECVRTAD
ncbi:WD40 repeat domain-containing protein [Frigoriglobus tundricola]|uniref:Anaphase-promoting complex subunit 4-like WD40 domain-containing protein n=1 Tax=Frigoriglobus tundricola TaxID=2774151 RepID=A0A6M5YZW7_9BACT|nr:WD40 repeat domain-containing protein [Frigoriglobus tundricola]QJW98482.1 hypothetical protein FTUN_6072 [Frigoriglobus tundricola]